jgi:hypothetical protein
MPVRVPSCRRTSVASPFFQERAATRVAHDAPSRRGHPRHAASVGMERVPLCSVCCRPDRGPPRGAPPSRVPGGCRASSPVKSSIPCCQAHACVSPSQPHPSAPWPQPRRGVAQRVGPRRRAARCGWCSGRWPLRREYGFAGTSVQVSRVVRTPAPGLGSPRHRACARTWRRRLPAPRATRRTIL